MPGRKGLLGRGGLNLAYKFEWKVCGLHSLFILLTFFDIFKIFLCYHKMFGKSRNIIVQYLSVIGLHLEKQLVLHAVRVFFFPLVSECKYQIARCFLPLMHCSLLFYFLSVPYYVESCFSFAYR